MLHLTGLKHLNLKTARKLESLDGLSVLQELETLWVQGAPKLADIMELDGMGSSVCELRFEACRAISSLGPVGALQRLRVLEIGDCGSIASLGPIAGLQELEELLAWGDTRVVDSDLSPLLGLACLRDLRMMSRRNYTPQLSVVDEVLQGRR